MSSAADVLELVGKVDRAATREVSRWLIDVEHLAEGGPETLADLGALVDRLSPSVLVNAHLMWRGAAIDMLEESDTDPALVEQVRLVLADRCDSGLVALSRQFDEPRDRLTGLANRTLLLERVDHALQASGRYGESVGLIYIEPGLGSETVDELVAEVADRLTRVSRSTDTVARLAGNHFVICAERLRNDLEAVAIADRAQLALSQPYLIDGDELRISVAVGIAVSSGGDGPETLLASASGARGRVHGQA
jgi:diguanylate cyclase (GGDEF)-like protein